MPPSTGKQKKWESHRAACADIMDGIVTAFFNTLRKLNGVYSTYKRGILRANRM
jgi:uncharacterized protein